MGTDEDNKGGSIEDLTERLRSFNSTRDWEQFHSPRNLLLALVGEVGELSSLLQWTSDAQVDAWLDKPKNRSAWSSELADVFSYLLQLAAATEIDLADVLQVKLAENERRYPVELARGSSAKYDELNGQ